MRKDFIIFALAFIFLVGTASAFGESISIDKKLKEGLTISPSADKYEAISIKGLWDFMPLVEDTKADLVLTKHDTSCGIDCMSEFQIVTYQDSPLVEDIKFYRLDEGKTEERNIRSYQFQIYGDVKDYTTECSPAKLTEEQIKNETKPYDVCIQVESGSHKDWVNYNIGEELEAGTYDVKLLGQKAPYMEIDWVIKTQNKIISEWATWGNISTGSQAEVRLNSPTNGSIQYTNLVTTNATANVTGGAYLVNATLYDNSTGTWGAKNVTDITITADDGLTISTIGTPNTNDYGWKITATQGLAIYSVNKNSASGATKAYIKNANGTATIATATFSGNIATFSSPVSLTNGISYRIVANGEGASIALAGKSGGFTTPISSTYFNIIKGINEGSEFDNQVFVFDYIKVLGATNTTINNTNTYSAGSNNLWNCQFCDSDGACGFAPANYTFSIDSIAPTINLSYPTALIDYGKLNGTLQLNFTATDTNLDKCWYNYNGTNSSVISCSSGVLSANTITLNNNKSIIIYANDMAGNLNATTFNWDYNVFENSRTVNSTSYETANEGYSINVTANSSLTAVDLEYNGTDIAMTNMGSGIWSYSRDLPTSIVGNNSIKFKFTYDTTFYSDTSYQNVLNTILVLCNATYNTSYLNITFVDESTLSSLNATMPLGTFDYYLGSGSVYKTLTNINTSQNARYSFCASPTTKTLNIDSYVQYASSGYPQRIWNPVATSYSNSTTSQILYLLASANGIYVTFQVVNGQDQLLSGVSVDAIRSISSVDVNVCSGTTGADGTVTCWLNPDFIHDFTFAKTGFTTYSTSFTPTQISYTITLAGGGGIVVRDYTKGINIYLYPNQQELFNGTSYTFGINVTSSYWDLDSFGYNLRLANGTIITGDTSTTAGSAALASYNVNNQSIIYMDYYWIVEGNTTTGTKYFIVTNSANTQWSIKNFFNRLNTYMDIGFFGLDDFGRYLIVFMILFISIGVMSYKYGLTSPLAVMSMTFLIVFFFDVVVGLLPTIRGIEHLLTYISGLILEVVVLKEITQ